MSSEENDCPLCLTAFEPYDHSHPLQCPSVHCHFNCCMDCLEHMIKSTKDDQNEASDGNTFRVCLHCPNCRSNLGPSIRDTLLLRKVDKYSYQSFKHSNPDGSFEVVDDSLSASDLRLKHALERDEDIASAIEAARLREDDFFGRGIEVEDEKQCSSFAYLGCPGTKSMSGSFSTRGTIWSFDDEEGYEADWANGPHNSFIYRHHSMEEAESYDDEAEDEPMQMDVKADSTLLFGLDAFMTEQEQQFMTSKLISGDTSRLAVATEMMHYVSALSRQGMKPSIKRQRSNLNRSHKPRPCMLESIKEVIREGNEARRLEEEKEACQVDGEACLDMAVVRLQFEGVAGGRRNQKQQADRELKQRMEYMKLHPLPLRMPKYAEVTASQVNSTSLTFVDDVWDGTVLDAYSKINVNTSLMGHVTITKQQAQSSGVRRVIDGGSHESPTIDTERPRVIVASINRELGQHGVVKGDVVTHFNGEAFSGNASELAELVASRYEGELMTFVFNADSAVAEALKRRSICSRPRKLSARIKILKNSPARCFLWARRNTHKLT